MSDPLGLVSQQGGMPIRPGAGLGKGFPGAPGAVDPTGGDFKKELLEQMDAVSKLQQDAEQAKAAGVAGEARIDFRILRVAYVDKAVTFAQAAAEQGSVLSSAYASVASTR